MVYVLLIGTGNLPMAHAVTPMHVTFKLLKLVLGWQPPHPSEGLLERFPPCCGCQHPCRVVEIRQFLLNGSMLMRSSSGFRKNVVDALVFVLNAGQNYHNGCKRQEEDGSSAHPPVAN